MGGLLLHHDLSLLLFGEVKLPYSHQQIPQRFSTEWRGPHVTLGLGRADEGEASSQMVQLLRAGAEFPGPTWATSRCG